MFSKPCNQNITQEASGRAQRFFLSRQPCPVIQKDSFHRAVGAYVAVTKCEDKTTRPVLKISEDAAALFTGLGHIHALMWLDIFDFNSFELSVLLFKVRPRVCLLSALVNSGELLVVRRMSRALWALPGNSKITL